MARSIFSISALISLLFKREVLSGWRDTHDRSNGNRLDSARAERIRAGKGAMIADADLNAPQ